LLDLHVTIKSLIPTTIFFRILIDMEHNQEWNLKLTISELFETELTEILPFLAGINRNLTQTESILVGSILFVGKE